MQLEQLEQLIEALNKRGFKVESVKEVSTGRKDIKGYKENIPFCIKISENRPDDQKMNHIIILISKVGSEIDINVELNEEKDSKYFEGREWIETLIKLIDDNIKKIQNNL